MDKIKRIILCPITTSICNFRCRYCYLSQRDEAYQGKQADFRYPPEYVAKAISKERLGGTCYFNLCADGETLLTKDIDRYVLAIVQEGHYVEIVSNLTVTSMLERILSFDKELLDRITFKCSFHYLQLKERGLLETFANNVNLIWKKGCSANIEVTPDDELVPYIDELKAFSMEHFGALPHLTIARDDRTGHGFLTELSRQEYIDTWSSFDSSFWRFKMDTFNVKREEYCYAGAWMLVLYLETGKARQCYCSRYEQNIFEDLTKPINWRPIGKCLDTHCYNSHALLTLGCIPGFTEVRYGDVRDRVRPDGSHWIQPKMKEFLNSKLEESNAELSRPAKMMNALLNTRDCCVRRIKRGAKRLFGGRKNHS